MSGDTDREVGPRGGLLVVLLDNGTIQPKTYPDHHGLPVRPLRIGQAALARLIRQRSVQVLAPAPTTRRVSFLLAGRAAKPFRRWQCGSMALLPADGHMHSEWSLDTRSGRGSMERMCARAMELGLPAVAFTDHLDLMAWQVESSDFEGLEQFKAFLTPDGALAPPPTDIGGYLECVDRCRVRFPDLQIITGAELGQPHRTAEAAAQIAGFGQLERVLGSLHVLSVGDQFFEPPGLYRLWPAADVIREYLAEVPRMLAGSDAFTVLAHIDYAVRYWPTREAGPSIRPNLRMSSVRRCASWRVAGGHWS